MSRSASTTPAGFGFSKIVLLYRKRRRGPAGCEDGPAMDEGGAALEAVRGRLRDARSVSALTGSGISAESGLPTFRGPGGLGGPHRVEQLTSPDGFARDPQLVSTWYNERRAAHTQI